MASQKTPPTSAKNLQIRLGPQAYEQLKRIAARREKSIADTIREAIEVYAINLAYAEKQQPLYWSDSDGNKTMVLIPGFNTPATSLMPPSSNTPQ